MNVAESVADVGVVAVRLEPVVDRDPAEGGEHPGVVKAIDPASVVQRVERRPLRAGAEQPAQKALGAGSGLVDVDYRARLQLGAHLFEERAEPGGAGLDDRLQRPG